MKEVKISRALLNSLKMSTFKDWDQLITGINLDLIQIICGLPNPHGPFNLENFGTI